MNEHAREREHRSAPVPTVGPSAPTEAASSSGELFRALAKAIFLAAGLLVLLWFLLRIALVLLFFGLALVLALALNAPVTWLERRGIPRLVATAATFSVLGAGVAVVGWLIVPPLIRETTTLMEALPQVAINLVDRVAEALSDYPEIERQLRVNAQTASQFVPWLLGTVRNLWNYGLTLVVLLVLGLVLIGVVLYMVLDPRPALAAYVSALPPHLREPGIRAFTRAPADHQT